jgi:hypothetical protein
LNFENESYEGWLKNTGKPEGLLKAEVILLQAGLTSTEEVANFVMPVSLPNSSSLKPTEGLSTATDYEQEKQLQINTVAL